MVGKGTALGHPQRGHDRETRADRIRERRVDNVGHRMFPHLLPAHGRERVADAPEKQPEVVIDFRRSADGRTRVARVDLLFDGNRRGKPLYEIGLRFLHLPKELASVGRKALNVAALPLGIYGVEGQRRLPRTGKPGYDNQFPTRDLQTDILEVVDSRPLYRYAVFYLYAVFI